MQSAQSKPSTIDKFDTVVMLQVYGRVALSCGLLSGKHQWLAKQIRLALPMSF